MSVSMCVYVYVLCVFVCLFVFVLARICMLTFDVQKPTTLTIDGVTELPPDSGRIAAVVQFRVLAAAAAPTEAAAAIACQLCDEGGPAVAYCEDCAEFACAECVTAHKRSRRTASHHVGELSAAGGAPCDAAKFRRPIRCREHPLEPLTMYCRTCAAAACLTCSVNKHPEHKIVELFTAGGGMRVQLRAAIEAIGFHPAAEVTYKAAMAAKIAEVDRIHAATVASIEGSRARLHAAADVRCDALKKVAGDLLAAQRAVLRAQTEGIELHLKGIAHVVDFARDVAEFGTNSEVLVTNLVTLARLAGAAEEHAKVEWTPACEGPSPWQAAAATALAAKAAEEQAGAEAAAVAATAWRGKDEAAAAARKKRSDDDAAAAAAAAIKKGAADAAAAAAALLRLRGACVRACV